MNDKITVERAWQRAQSLIERNVERNALYRRLDNLYFQEHNDEPDSEAVQRIHMPYATAVVDLISDLAALMEVHISVPAASESAAAQREADNIEAWLRAWLAANQKQQQRNIVGEAAWLAAQRAQVVARTLFVESSVRVKGGNADGEDSEDEEYELSGLPVVLQLRDPAHVYIESGASGVRYVVEQWTRRAGEVRELYPDSLSDDLPEDADVEWTEYWDDKYCIYFADGEVVRNGGKEIVEHGYGCIPYAVGHGRTTPFKAGTRRYRPVLAGVEDLAKSIDTAFSIMGTASLSGAVAAWAVFADGQRDLDLTPLAVNQFRKDERIEPLQRASMPADFFQFLTLLLQAWQSNTVPFNLFGQSPGDLAGYAISLLSQAGRRVIQPIWRAIQDCLAGAMRNAVLICRNKVAPIVGDSVPLVIVAPGESRRVKRSIRLDTAKIGDDFDVDVTLDDPMPSDEAANIRMALETTKGGLLSKQTALAKFKIVPDSLAELDRIAIERVTEQLLPYEGAKLAVERGYLPKDMTPPPGWVVMPNGLLRPAGLMPQAEQQAGSEEPGGSSSAPAGTMQQAASEMGVNPAAMQALSGQPPMMTLADLAGAPPPVST